MVDPMAHVYLPDSWVLDVQTAPDEVCFTIDAVLERDHPRFYWPPHPGEQHAYARLRWCLRGEVRWNDGPRLDRPAVDATGERDFGGFDTWRHEDGTDLLEGEWGSVTVRAARHVVIDLDTTDRRDPSSSPSTPTTP